MALVKLNRRPEVYADSEDSWLLQEQVAKFCRDKKVLDVGCGLGIQAITAALNGAKEVDAVDINPIAVQLTKENATLNNTEIEVFESDLFSNVKGKFDLIIFNAPYLPMTDLENVAVKEGFDIECIKWAGGKPLIEKFLRQAKEYLEDNGMVLLVFSSLTNLDAPNMQILSRRRMGFEEIYVASMTKQFL